MLNIHEYCELVMQNVPLPLENSLQCTFSFNKMFGASFKQCFNFKNLVMVLI